MATTKPPMQKSDEANKKQLKMARAQGDAMQTALNHMLNDVADDGDTKRADDYLVSYAVEKAEGMYKLENGELVWQEPQQENVHIEVAVCDAGDGRFIPGLTIYATLIDGDGNKVGTHQQPFIWHPWLYHYGRNWQVPGDGRYTLKVQIEAPTFMRHDEKNGKRYAAAVEVKFDDVTIETGQA